MKRTIPHAQLEVSKSAVLSNLRRYRSLLKKSTRMLVVTKANSYGHGATEFAKLLEEAGVDYLGVATPTEGIGLRQSGIVLPILVLTAGNEYYPQIIANGLEAGIPTLESLKRFTDVLEASGRSSYPIHLPIDTGMHRLGFMEKDVDEMLDFLAQQPNIEVKSVYSHLVAADEPAQDEFTLSQIALFEKISDKITARLGYRPIRHILNSAGIERFTGYQMDMVRLGLGVYGFSASGQPLDTTAFFRCPIIQIKELTPEDGTVGYGRHGVLTKPLTRVATIPVGYADGLNRRFGKGNAAFEVNGCLAPTIGTICMDMCMIDITGIDAEVGDIVTIFGDTPSAADLAKKIDTIPYEIFTGLDSRVKRVLTD